MHGNRKRDGIATSFIGTGYYNMKTDSRARNWTTIVYPDSAPDNWREIISQMKIPWIESPQHNRDVFPDGTLKKAHWHILLMFGSKKSFQQVKQVTGSIHAAEPQKCHSTTGMVRYFAHIDNPEKYQYDVKKIIGHGGAQPSKYLVTSEQKKQDKLNAIKQMMKYVKTHQITEYSDLCDYAAENEPDWFESLTTNSSYVMHLYVNSVRYKLMGRHDR